MFVNTLEFAFWTGLRSLVFTLLRFHNSTRLHLVWKRPQCWEAVISQSLDAVLRYLVHFCTWEFLSAFNLQSSKLIYSGICDSSFPRVNDTPGMWLRVGKQGLHRWPEELPSGLRVLTRKASSALGWDSDSGLQTSSCEEQNEVVKRIFAAFPPGAVQIWRTCLLVLLRLTNSGEREDFFFFFFKYVLIQRSEQF